MEIVQHRKLWLHTHFVTDCVRLSHTQGRDIEAALLPVLRQQHIVYDFHFIELVTYVTQQVQEGEEISVHLAHLHRLLQEKSLERGLLNALIISFDVPQLRRLLHRERVSDALASPPPVLGRRMTLYKAILPRETQARIATDSLITRYLCWLARNSCGRAIALANTNRHVRLFIPEGSNFDPQQAWHEFMNFVFSGAELGRTFIERPFLDCGYV